MKDKSAFKHKLTVLITAVCLLITIPLSSCTNKGTNNDIDLRSIYQGKDLTADFSLRVNITDVSKSLFTIAYIDGVFDISYKSGVYLCELTSFRVKLDSTDATIEYDSANTYNDEATLVRISPYSAFLGVTFTATVDSTGRISALTGFEQVEENIREELSQYGDVVVEQALFAAKEYLDDSVLKMILGLFLGYIPEKDFDRTQNWVYNEKIKAPFILNTNLSCTYNKTEDSEFLISTIGTLKTAVDEKNYTGVEYALTGTSDSKIYLSESNDNLRHGTYTENVTGYSYYTINGSDVKDSITMTRNITFSMKEKE